MHVLMELRRREAYEKQARGLSSKTEYVVLFSKVSLSDLVLFVVI